MWEHLLMLWRQKVLWFTSLKNADRSLSSFWFQTSVLHWKSEFIYLNLWLVIWYCLVIDYCSNSSSVGVNTALQWVSEICVFISLTVIWTQESNCKQLYAAKYLWSTDLTDSIDCLIKIFIVSSKNQLSWRLVFWERLLQTLKLGWACVPICWHFRNKSAIKYIGEKRGIIVAVIDDKDAFFYNIKNRLLLYDPQHNNYHQIYCNIL